MSTGALRAILLVLTIVLAGCSGLPATGDADPPESTPAEATPSNETLVSGLTERGVADSAALADAHAAALNGTAYVASIHETQRYENGTLQAGMDITARFAADERQYHVAYEPAGEAYATLPERIEQFADGTRVAEAWLYNGETNAQVVSDDNDDPVDPLDRRPDFRERDRLALLFDLVEFEVTERGERDGAVRYTLESTDATNVEEIGSKDVESVENVSMTAVVDEHGIVHEYQLRYDAVADGESVSVTRAVEYDDIGAATVETPEWTDRLDG